MREPEAIQASHPSARKYVTVYSQSAWNDTHAKTAGPSEGLKAPYYDFKQFPSMGVNVQHIQDQNLLLSTTKDKFYWLRNSSDPDLQWLYSRSEVAFPFPETKFDCSGAGLRAPGESKGRNYNATTQAGACCDGGCS